MANITETKIICHAAIRIRLFGQRAPSVQSSIIADPEGFLPRVTGAPRRVLQGFLLPVHQRYICGIEAYTFVVNCTIPALTITRHNGTTR